MTDYILPGLLIFFAVLAGILTVRKPKPSSAPDDPDLPLKPPAIETLPPEPPPAPPPGPPPPEPVRSLDFSTPRSAYHAVRVLCDEAGLSFANKNLICAVIYQESRFSNAALNHNRNKAGVITSTDYGICQINDYFHIGAGKSFPSVEYVLEHPDLVVQWMIRQFKLGNLKWWVGYSSGAYRQWLVPGSPMWKLA